MPAYKDVSVTRPLLAQPRTMKRHYQHAQVERCAAALLFFALSTERRRPVDGCFAVTTAEATQMMVVSVYDGVDPLCLSWCGHPRLLRQETD